ncbi:hypothetical protein SAY86_008137 [Trapa natans]|uniref:Uncharacterized protein n=1 Tax=Trapa natans TaxID=22666 RepID=A0AAN7K905_TRANT|nr:hypothetical protein SAY86_008137 [Trapa natans]
MTLIFVIAQNERASHLDSHYSGILGSITDFVNNGPVNRAQDAGPHEQDRSLHNDMEEEDEQ